MRQKRSVPFVADLEGWMRGHRDRLSRHADVAEAMNYMLKRWKGFTRFLDDGRICLTNNAAERALRGIALGRKSWLFAGSDRGGQRAGLLLRHRPKQGLPTIASYGSIKGGTASCRHDNGTAPPQQRAYVVSEPSAGFFTSRAIHSFRTVIVSVWPFFAAHRTAQSSFAWTSAPASSRTLTASV